MTPERRPRELDVDLVTTEVIRHGLNGAADQMRVSLVRCAFSPIIYEVLDFAAGLYDRDMRLLAQAHALPLFLGTLGYCIEASVERLGGAEELEPGDVLFSTYGYDIGSHPQDAAVIIPIFYQDELIAFAAVKAHHMDIGAKNPYCTDTTDNFQEGTIFPGVRLYRRGVRQEDLYRTLVANSRMPTALVGDLSAQIGAAGIGAEALVRIVDRYGLIRFKRATEVMFDQGEAAVRRCLEQIPDGIYRAASFMDNDGITNEPVPLEVSVEVAGTDVIVDLTSAPDARPGPINVPYASTVSGVRIGIMGFAGAAYSANEGHFRPIVVRTRPGSMLHALPPSPLFMYGWPMLHTIDLIHRALADVLPEAIPAGSGGDVCAVTWWGEDAKGRLWVDGGDHFVGMGATYNGDGACPLMHIACSGIRNVPAEVIESRLPVTVERFEFATDSGGAGEFRGGCGVDIFYRLDRPASLTLPWERTKTAPWGLHGGQAGRANDVRIRHRDNTTTAHTKVTDLHVEAGAVLELRTGGGGGYGRPERRPAASVHDDIVDGLVSGSRARDSYPHVELAPPPTSREEGQS